MSTDTRNLGFALLVALVIVGTVATVPIILLERAF